MIKSLVTELLESSGPMPTASDFQTQATKSLQNTVSFTEWPVNFQIYSLMASKWNHSRNSALPLTGIKVQNMNI